MTQVIYPDSVAFEFECENISYNQKDSFVHLVFDKSIEKLFSTRAEYNIIFDDTLHFYIKDIKLRTDTFGMSGTGNWAIACSVDSFTVNGTKIKSSSNIRLYPPVSLMKSYKNK